MIKRIKDWFFPPNKNKWYCPPHVCKHFRQYYSLNLKICTECHKESELWGSNIIKHQR